jgi:GTP-binding protein EngB required for normal cell division
VEASFWLIYQAMDMLKLAHKNKRIGKNSLHIIYYIAKNLSLINILIDSRRGIKEHDITIMDLIIFNQIPIQIICTKADEIKNHDALKEEINNFIKDKYNFEVNIIFTSTKKTTGIQDLQKSFISLL